MTKAPRRFRGAFFVLQQPYAAEWRLRSGYNEQVIFRSRIAAREHAAAGRRRHAAAKEVLKMEALVLLFALFAGIVAAVLGADLPQEQAMAVKGAALLFFIAVAVALVLRRIFTKSPDLQGGPNVPTAVGLQDDINSHHAGNDGS